MFKSTTMNASHPALLIPSCHLSRTTPNISSMNRTTTLICYHTLGWENMLLVPPTNIWWTILIYPALLVLVCLYVPCKLLLSTSCHCVLCIDDIQKTHPSTSSSWTILILRVACYIWSETDFHTLSNSTSYLRTWDMLLLQFISLSSNSIGSSTSSSLLTSIPKLLFWSHSLPVQLDTTRVYKLLGMYIST